MDSYQQMYMSISRKLIDAKIVTQHQCDTICRKGGRKNRYWRRHVMDLCGFAIDIMDMENIENEELRVLCTRLSEHVIK